MADTISIPGIGNTKKKTVYAVGIGIVLVGAAVYYRNKQSAAAAQAASVAQAGTDTTDPATGYPYGSPEDAAALNTQAGYYQSVDGSAGGYYGGSPSPGQGTGFISNAAWAQAYEEYAVNNIQSDSTTVAAALGKYLTGQPLTQDQLNIVEQAIAFEGLPPIAGTNGYPPSYNLGTTAPPTVPTQSTGVGNWNLSAVVKGPTEVDLSWANQGSNYPSYQINYGIGSTGPFKTRVSGTTARIGALKPSTTYQFSISAIDTKGNVHSQSPYATLTTPA